MNQDNSVSIIKMYGEVITDKTYITNPAIARDEEINKMILALITPDKSALLVGKPGIGKTAIVEGLAYRIHHNMVPNAIAGWKIIKINLPALFGKMVVNGAEVSKLQLLIDEIDNIEKTILFIDEVHLLVNKNGGVCGPAYFKYNDIPLQDYYSKYQVYRLGFRIILLID